MTVDPALRYEAISPKAYEHPADRAATAALGSIPLMDQLIRRLSDLGHERRLRQVLLGNAVRIGTDQVPALWDAFGHCVGVLDLEATPELYVTQTPIVNAMTVGARNPVVIVYSSLVGSYEPLEVRTVLAHEVGHVLSEHYRYTTALVVISQVVQGVLPRSLLMGLPVRALYAALLEWSRMAELSCDRAAALVLVDPLPVCRTLMRVAGGALEGMNLDAFIRQATEYEDEDDLWARHSRFWEEVGRSHPFAVSRVRQLVQWVTDGDFDRIRSGHYVRRGQEPPPSAEFEAAMAHYGERFTGMVERVGGGVERVADQIGDWLRARQQRGGPGPSDPEGDWGDLDDP
ncbi:MAG TPA: M48 family metallopeptidase [Acidimicrobiales bacterium]|nr:M48 family metallopeptidase [Acidimicrobiales bacterium]